MKIYRRIFTCFKPYVGSILIALLLMLATVGLNLLKPWPIKWLIDEVIPNSSLQGIILTIHEPIHVMNWAIIHGSIHAMNWVMYACILLVLIYFLHGIANLANSFLLIKIGLKALQQLRTEMYTVLQHLPLHFHDGRRSGDSTFRVAYDSQAIQTIFNRGFATILGALITLIGTFAVMFAMSRQLALWSLVVVPILWGAIHFFADRIRRESMVVQQGESDVLSRASEGLTSIRIIHAFGRQDYEIHEFTKEAEQSREANLRLSVTNTLSSLVVSVITSIGTAGILYLGVHAVMIGTLKVGDLWVFLSYLAMLYQPLEQLSYTTWAMEGATAGMQRVFEILDAQDTVPEKKGARAVGRLNGEITLENVGFGYESSHPILRDLSLTIQPGQTVALVGGTGAGKTTILSLIPRFYDVDKGRVLVDGQEVRDLTKQSLRQNVSIVLQDTLLLSGTVEENIAYGRPQADHSEIRKAAEAAQADDFIMQLPEGYATQVGERGVRLSGGQKQRLGIARAFLKGAPILLLDEPTSALDLQTEAEIMGTLKNLMARQTTVIVTHRLNTIHHVDTIYVLANGQIVEKGTGPELLANGGLYAQLWKAGNS